MSFVTFKKMPLSLANSPEFLSLMKSKVHHSNGELLMKSKVHDLDDKLLMKCIPIDELPH